MPDDKPTAAFVLSLLGGIFVLVFGLLVGLLFGFFFLGLGIITVILAIIFGILIIIGGTMMYVYPHQHVIWGIIVLVFSVLSIFVALGGFLVGMILGIIGGALGIAWQPGSAVRASGAWRTCMGCGRPIPWEYMVCPYCGTRAPTIAPAQAWGTPQTWGGAPQWGAQAYTAPQAQVPYNQAAPASPAQPAAPSAPAAATTATVPCVSCGRDLLSNAPTCTHCGASQPSGEPPAPPPAE